MNRYYLSNNGLGQFLAGFGAKHQEVEAIENRQTALQNQAWGQAIGSGLQTAGQVGAMGIMDAGLSNLSMPGGMGPPAISDMQRMYIIGRMMPGLSGMAGAAGDIAQQQAGFANQRALQQAGFDQQIKLENQRSGNDILERTNIALDQALGLAPTTTRGTSQGYPTLPFGGADQGIGTNMDGSVMMPDQPPQQQGTVPLPSLDPAMTTLYRDAENTRANLVQARKTIMADTTLSPQMKAAALQELIPQASEAYGKMRSYSRPAPPTIQQQAEMGRIPGTMNTIFTDAKGTPHNFVLHPEETAPWVDPTTGTVDAAQQEADFNAKVKTDTQGRTWSYKPKTGEWETVKDDKGEKQPDYGKHVPSVKFEIGETGQPKYDPRTQEDLAQAAILEQNATKIVKIKDLGPKLLFSAQQGKLDVAQMNDLLQEIAILYPDINAKSVDPKVRNIARDLDYYLTYQGD